MHSLPTLLGGGGGGGGGLRGHAQTTTSSQNPAELSINRSNSLMMKEVTHQTATGTSNLYVQLGVDFWHKLSAAIVIVLELAPYQLTARRW